MHEIDLHHLPHSSSIPVIIRSVEKAKPSALASSIFATVIGTLRRAFLGHKSHSYDITGQYFGIAVEDQGIVWYNIPREESLHDILLKAWTRPPKSTKAQHHALPHKPPRYPPPIHRPTESTYRADGASAEDKKLGRWGKARINTEGEGNRCKIN